MKSVLLISGRVMHYRTRIYNRFYDFFKEKGYELHVVATSYQDTNVDIRYVQHYAFSVGDYVRVIETVNPCVCIVFFALTLYLKNIRIIFYCKRKKIPFVFWGHGINLKTPDAKIKNCAYHFFHRISNAIILYSAIQKKYIKDVNHKKTFVAPNTLDFSDVDVSQLRKREDVRALYKIKEPSVLLYISRIVPYKNLDVLLELFSEEKDIALVIVGPGINEKQLEIIDANSNYYYLGEKYGQEVYEIYQMGDVFSTPGHIGLALNQAMFFGKPVVVLRGKHAPEIVYLHNGENGFIVDTKEELKSKIIELCTNPVLYKEFSQNALDTFSSEMRIENMFSGFYNAVSYCINSPKKE